MAIYANSLAQKIPWIEQPGGLPSMVTPRVRHDGKHTPRC